MSVEVGNGKRWLTPFIPPASKQDTPFAEIVCASTQSSHVPNIRLVSKGSIRTALPGRIMRTTDFMNSIAPVPIF